MKILILHNRYRFAGGEDASVSLEAELLRTNGHAVLEHLVDNRDLAAAPWIDRARIAWESNWSKRRHEEVRALCREHRPDIAHVHNFWPQLTPSVYSACRSEGAAVVQTIRNFRLMCLNGTFFRQGRHCTLCRGRSPWPGILFRCYRGSWTASIAAARMIVDNRRRKTWEHDVDQWIAMSEHSRAQFAEFGIPAEKMIIKPNFCPDSGPPVEPDRGRPIFLYVGRLSPEKGIFVLLEAWRKVRAESPSFEAELRIAGDGPSKAEVEKEAASLGSVSILGWLAPPQVALEIRRSHAVVVPSLVPETFGRSVIEAWSCARPVLAADLGALSELIRDRADGRLHAPGDAAALAAHLREIATDAAGVARMGRAGYQRWRLGYSPETNYAILMKAYERARENRAKASP